MDLSAMVTCPKCKTRVLPKADGTCPSCQFVFPQNKELPPKKVDLVKSKKTTNRIAEESKTSRGQSPIKPNTETKKSKDIVAINAKQMSKEEYKERYRQQRVHHDPNMPRPNPSPLDQGIAPFESRENHLENVKASGIGMLTYLLFFGLLGPKLFPNLAISKTLFVVLCIVSAILGIVVKDWLKKNKWL